jgi:DNA-binding transcriptional LysR family regulator
MAALLAGAKTATMTGLANLVRVHRKAESMLENLRTFIDVARRGTFSAVANARSVAVSSVARQVDALEGELAVRLFHRSSRRLVLTDAGEQFLRHAQAIIAEFEEAKTALVDGQAEPRGSLSVAAPSSFGRRHVVPAVSAFLERFPHIDLELNLSDEWVDLASTRTDLAIRIGVLPDSDLIATRLAATWRVACASPAYLQRHGRPDRPEDLLKHSCLTVPSGTRTPAGWWTFVGVNKGRPLPVRGRFTSNDTDALLQSATAGLGIVHLSSWLVCDLIDTGCLVCLFDSGQHAAEGPSSAVHAVWHKGRSHAKKAQLFIAHLRETFGTPTYWDKMVARALKPESMRKRSSSASR